MFTYTIHKKEKHDFLSQLYKHNSALSESSVFFLEPIDSYNNNYSNYLII